MAGNHRDYDHKSFVDRSSLINVRQWDRMSVRGLRIQIAGSSAVNADKDLLGNAHTFVRELAENLVDAGAGLVMACGDEPIGCAGLPAIFDWTALSVVAEAPDPGIGWPDTRAGRFRVSISQSGLERIPNARSTIWGRCTSRSDFELMTIAPGWKFGGALRAQQVRMGDVLVTLGGGAGVEHLAELYQDEGKPVIPLEVELGAIANDGRGGSSYLHQMALHGVHDFFELRDGAGGAAARLAGLRIERATDGRELAAKVTALLEDLRPARAFYVRLLDRGSVHFDTVDRFFREIVDPVITEMGFTPHQVGRDRPLAAFLNVEIFEGLHRAGLVVVDLTDVRPNCTMELGYALGRHRRTVISAMRGTMLPFDQDKLPTYFWDVRGTDADHHPAYRAWIEQHLEMPVLVSSQL